MRIFRTRRFGLVRCTACGCYRIDPPPLAADVESAPFYTDYYAKGDRVVDGLPSPEEAKRGRQIDSRASRFWRVVKRVPELGRPLERVVDVGCGEGHLCGELKSAGWRWVAGFDVSASRVARARETYDGIQFYDCAFPGTVVEAGSLDLVVMDNVIEHLPNPAAILRSVWASLKPGGRLTVITPNMRSGHFRLLGRRWTPELGAHAHIFLFTPQALERLIAMTGFSIETTGNFHLEFFPLREWLRLWGRGELKEAVWRAVQEAGTYYARLVDAGPMIYSVARREDPPESSRCRLLAKG